MLKEALSMILGPCLIFCINYIQRKLKRCFSRAQHFYAYTPLANSLWKSWTVLEVLYFTVVWCWGGDHLLGFCSNILESPRKAGLKDRWGATRCHLRPPSSPSVTEAKSGILAMIKNGVWLFLIYELATTLPERISSSATSLQSIYSPLLGFYCALLPGA